MPFSLTSLNPRIGFLNQPSVVKPALVMGHFESSVYTVFGETALHKLGIGQKRAGVFGLWVVPSCPILILRY